MVRSVWDTCYKNLTIEIFKTFYEWIPYFGIYAPEYQGLLEFPNSGTIGLAVLMKSIFFICLVY